MLRGILLSEHMYQANITRLQVRHLFANCKLAMFCMFDMLGTISHAIKTNTIAIQWPLFQYQTAHANTLMQYSFISPNQTTEES